MLVRESLPLFYFIQKRTYREDIVDVTYFINVPTTASLPVETKGLLEARVVGTFE